MPLRELFLRAKRGAFEGVVSYTLICTRKNYRYDGAYRLGDVGLHEKTGERVEYIYIYIYKNLSRPMNQACGGDNKTVAVTRKTPPRGGVAGGSGKP